MEINDNFSIGTEPKLPSWRFLLIRILGDYYIQYALRIEKKSITERAIFWTAAATVIAALAACVSVIVALLQWNVLRGTLDEMKDEQRPWIGSPKVEIYSQDNSVARFKFTFTNIGHYPTFGFFVTAAPFYGDGDWEKQINTMCENGQKLEKSDSKQFYLWTAVPNAESVIDKTIGILSDLHIEDELTPKFSNMTIEKEKSFLVSGIKTNYLIGCVVYAWPKGILHRTGILVENRYKENGDLYVFNSYTVEPD